MVQLSVFRDSVPDGHAPEVLVVHDQPVHAPLMPGQGLDLISNVVTMDDITFTTLLSQRVSVTYRFDCRGLVDKGLPQSFIHQGPFDH